MVRFAFSSVIGPSKYLRSNHAIACCRTIARRFDPQALTSLTTEADKQAIIAGVSIHRLLRA